jgi:hypothetical protein
MMAPAFSVFMGNENSHAKSAADWDTSILPGQGMTLSLHWDNTAEELDTEMDPILSFLDHIETIPLHWNKGTLAVLLGD